MGYDEKVVNKLNADIEKFGQVFPVTEDMDKSLEGVSRMVMLDRYSFKDTAKDTLSVEDVVVLIVRPDPKFPATGTGVVHEIDEERGFVWIKVDEEFRMNIEDEEEQKTGIVRRTIAEIDKPLELYYEQIAKRNANALAEVEKNPNLKEEAFEEFYQQLSTLSFVPAGRVLYGAGSGADVTYFNCYVLPFVEDSRGGISEHRKRVMEIMSRGGGVGTNGSTLRPRNVMAKGVNGKSSGSVGWLDDIARLTHQVSQGGSRRGAQMIMKLVSHPDIIEFVISKVQNPRILRFIIANTDDEEIKELAKAKLKFTPLTPNERAMYELVLSHSESAESLKEEAKQKLEDGGTYSVNDPEFLSGANISVCLTDDFMQAAENDEEFELRFPDVENYTEEEMEYYDAHWQECGDPREWESTHNMRVRTYRTINAKDLWDLIGTCATYSAEPGIFYIDNANDKTNATSYGQKVVATNPCGEQPLAPWSVCNLAAVNLAEMVNKETKEVDWERLKKTVKTGVRMQDNVIDATPYFLEENKKQALGERRVGLGVMGLADLLIYCEKEYGSEEGDKLTDEVFATIATSAYEESIELAKTRGSFPFLEDREAFINTGFMKNMPEYIREDILKYGIRNSHLLTVAPTGSTGTLVGVGTGLEPYFSFTYYRSGRLGKNIEVNATIVEEYLNENPDVSRDNLPHWFTTAMKMSPEAHARTQNTIQRWVDSSISKTVNAPKGYTVSQVTDVYEMLYKGGAKGGTVYVDGSRDAQVLRLSPDEEPQEELSNSENLYSGTDVNEEEQAVGNNPGDTCPLCHNGTLLEAGGCVTCENCNAQIKCGL